MKATEQLPLTETSFFILLSLATAPKHGYGIMKDVDRLSEQRVILATGTLYSALRRMLEDGWIERVEDPASTADLRERKRYQLTGTGRRILEAEAERLNKLVSLTRLMKAGETR